MQISSIPIWLSLHPALYLSFSVFLFLFFEMGIFIFLSTHCPDVNDGNAREKKKCVWLLSIWKEDAFYLCRSIYMASVWYVFIVLHVDIRFQRLTLFFQPVYSNANGFLLKAGKNAFLHSFRKKPDGKKTIAFLFIEWATQINSKIWKRQTLPCHALMQSIFL